MSPNIPKVVYDQIDEGTSNDMLHRLADEHGVDFQLLWSLRHRLKIRFERGVSSSARDYRNRVWR